MRGGPVEPDETFTRRVLKPSEEAVTELSQVRRGDLQSLSSRLGALEKAPRSRKWNGAAVIFVSVALGSLVTGIPLLSQADVTAPVLIAYIAAIVLCVALAVASGLAGRSLKDERADSVSAIKAELDRLLAAYPDEPTASPLSPEDDDAGLDRDVYKPFLQQLRREARDNLRRVQDAIRHGKYWAATDPDKPTTKEWDEVGFILQDDKFEDAYEHGHRAAQEVQRLAGHRPWRQPRGRRPIERDDRLPEALEVFERFDQALMRAIEKLDEEAKPR